MKLLHRDGLPHLCLFAIKEIAKGQEILYNYGDGDYPWRKRRDDHEKRADVTAKHDDSYMELSVEVDDDDDYDDDQSDSYESTGSFLAELLELCQNTQDKDEAEVTEEHRENEEPHDMTCGMRGSSEDNVPIDNEPQTEDQPEASTEGTMQHDVMSDSSEDNVPTDVEPQTKDNPEASTEGNLQCDMRDSNEDNVPTDIEQQTKDHPEASTEGTLQHDVMSDSDEDDVPIDILRDETNPSIYIRKVVKSSTTSKGKVKKTPRVHNSYQYCHVCSKKVSNFSQHIRRKNPDDIHSRDPILKEILSIESKEEQNRQLALLRNRFNHINNLKTLEEGKGELILERRPTSTFAKEKYGPCPKCMSWCIASALQKHQEHCPASERILTHAEISTQSAVLSHRIDKRASTKLVNEVFTIMHNDIIGEVARSDTLIVTLGNQWMEKNVGNVLKRGKYTSEIMRLVARFLIALRKLTGLELAMWEFLKPSHFDNLAKATLMVSEADGDDQDDLRYPSNARKLGFDLKRLLNLKIGLCIEQENHSDQQDAENVAKQMNIFWGTRVAKLANVLLEERRFNVRQTMPMPEDIERLNDTLNKAITELKLNDISASNYVKISELCLVKLMVYNRRRTGEMEGCR